MIWNTTFPGRLLKAWEEQLISADIPFTEKVQRRFSYEAIDSAKQLDSFEKVLYICNDLESCTHSSVCVCVCTCVCVCVCGVR